MKAGASSFFYRESFEARLAGEVQWLAVEGSRVMHFSIKERISSNRLKHSSRNRFMIRFCLEDRQYWLLCGGTGADIGSMRLQEKFRRRHSVEKCLRMESAGTTRRG